MVWKAKRKKERTKERVCLWEINFFFSCEGDPLNGEGERNKLYLVILFLIVCCCRYDSKYIFIESLLQYLRLDEGKGI